MMKVNLNFSVIICMSVLFFSEALKKHIFLRNYLSAHEIERREYCKIKSKGAKLYPDNISKYIEYKSGFIDEIYKNM
ncbi:GrpB family protein [Liquorilactobacillus ghanensis]|uniref:GrpB family protein n=2 Tax=Liquorilactobacillus ghanensis TaxID=399370 RepID=UPI0039EBE1B0